MSGVGSDKDAPVCLVTGASRGIGYAVAEALGRAKAQIIATARTVGGLEELDDAIRGAGGAPALLVPLDLTDGDGIDRLGPVLLERYGRLDLLVHCAAQAANMTPVAHVRPKDFEALLRVNVLPAHRLIRALDPLLRLAPAPRAVFLLDDRCAGQPHRGAYGAGEAALAALAQSYAAESPKVTVTLFRPKPCATALRARTHPGEDRGGLAAPTEVAEALLRVIEFDIE